MILEEVYSANTYNVDVRYIVPYIHEGKQVGYKLSYRVIQIQIVKQSVIFRQNSPMWEAEETWITNLILN